MIMNEYFKSFLQRGLVFGGFGPITIGIVYVVIAQTLSDFSLSGNEVCLAIFSSYVLAFIQAGASVFNQIEHWPITKSLFCHFTTLFAAYSICYIVNSWIPFEPKILMVFAIVFIAVYFVVWTTVYISVKVMSKKLNKKLHNA